MQWVRDPSLPYRVEIICENMFCVPEAETQLKEALRWYKQNNMMVWHDTLFTIRFTNEKNLVWFLLRWS